MAESFFGTVVSAVFFDTAFFQNPYDTDIGREIMDSKESSDLDGCSEENFPEPYDSKGRCEIIDLINKATRCKKGATQI